MKTAVPERAQQGFKVCGLWPCDPKVFNDDDFEAAPEDTPASTSSPNNPRDCITAAKDSQVSNEDDFEAAQ